MTPVEIPDPSIHKHCMKCKKWYEPTDGAVTSKEVTGPIGSIARKVEALAGDPSDMKFTCSACIQGANNKRKFLWGVLAAILVLSFALDYFGV